MRPTLVSNTAGRLLIFTRQEKGAAYTPVFMVGFFCVKVSTATKKKKFFPLWTGALFVSQLTELSFCVIDSVNIGHSRTIVGYDMLKDKSVRLLLFDPSMRTTEVNVLR